MKNSCILFLILVLFSCSDDFKHEPTGGSDSNIPDPVRNVQVKENIPGGAIITYDIPDNVDIQYVKAVYTTSHGVKKDVIVSSYTNSLTIKGLGDTDERIIQLYAVNRQEKTSEPVGVTIRPLAPPVENIRKSLGYAADFGGFMINFENEVMDEVAISVLVKDSVTSEMLAYDALYTSLAKGKYAVRGLPNKENKFGVFIRDRWDNMSDTLYFTLTPWKEDYLNKKLFRSLFVAGDVTWTGYTGAPQYAWDDKVGNGNFAHTEVGPDLPHRLTIDLGVNVKLSRFKMWQRPGNDVLYQHGAFKHYKVYGRADDPGVGNKNNVLEGWTLLVECHSFKPSGLPLAAKYTSEDAEFAAKGEEFSFPRDVPSIRYLRFENIETWSGMICSVVSEVAFWGDIQQ